MLTLGILLSVMATSVSASKFTDAHGSEVELDDTLEAYSSVVLSGADNAARKAETNLGDLWTDALRWFAVSGKINEYFDEDDVAAGNNKVDVDADHIVALWNAGNLRADIAVGKFGAAELAAVLPYPNKVAVIYMSDALTVDDGWIQRKNPGVIVKVVERSVLGSGVQSTRQAEAVCGALKAREGWSRIDAVQNGRVILLSEELLSGGTGKTGAEVLLAKAIYPALFGDTDGDEALRALTQEAYGAPASGTFIYVG